MVHHAKDSPQTASPNNAVSPNTNLIASDTITFHSQISPRSLNKKGPTNMRRESFGTEELWKRISSTNGALSKIREVLSPSTIEEQKYRYHPVTLHFLHGELEKEFEDFYYDKPNNTRSLVLQFFSIVFTFLYIPIDALLPQTNFVNFVLVNTIVPIACVIQVFILIILFFFRKWTRRRYVLDLILFTGGAIYLFVTGFRAAAIHYYDPSFPMGSMMISILVYIALRIKMFPFALGFVAVMSMSYLFSQLGFQYSHFVSVKILTYVAFIICTQLFGVVLLYSIERQYRISFVCMKLRDDDANRIAFENERSEKILANIIPKVFISQVKNQKLRFVNYYETATVIFSDIASFTKWASVMKSSDVIKVLNLHFSMFDSLALRFGVEKVKTIGDAYFAVAVDLEKPGSIAKKSEKQEKDVQRLQNKKYAKWPLTVVRMALHMQRIVHFLNMKHGWSIEVRIGISTNEVMIGCIGEKMLTFDCFGSAVTIAKYCEETADKGSINVDKRTYEATRHIFEFSELKKPDMKYKMFTITPTRDYKAERVNTPADEVQKIANNGNNLQQPYISSVVRDKNPLDPSLVVTPEKRSVETLFTPISKQEGSTVSGTEILETIQNNFPDQNSHEKSSTQEEDNTATNCIEHRNVANPKTALEMNNDKSFQYQGNIGKSSNNDNYDNTSVLPTFHIDSKIIITEDIKLDVNEMRASNHKYISDSKTYIVNETILPPSEPSNNLDDYIFREVMDDESIKDDLEETQASISLKINPFLLIFRSFTLMNEYFHDSFRFGELTVKSAALFSAFAFAYSLAAMCALEYQKICSLSMMIQFAMLIIQAFTIVVYAIFSFTINVLGRNSAWIQSIKPVIGVLVIVCSYITALAFSISVLLDKTLTQLFGGLVSMIFILVVNIFSFAHFYIKVALCFSHLFIMSLITHLLYINPSLSSLGQLGIIFGCITIISVVSYSITLTSMRAFVNRKKLMHQLLSIHKNQDKNNDLILSVLPANIADRLYSKTVDLTPDINGEAELISDTIPDGVVLFVQITGFEDECVLDRKTEAITMLNRLFTEFDNLTLYHNCIKIKSIGSTYIIVGNAQLPKNGLAQMATLAQQIIVHSQVIISAMKQSGTVLANWYLGVGLNIGDYSAGVLGLSKYLYDVFGDAVNVSSRMAATTTENTIQLCEGKTVQLLESEQGFKLEPRGEIFVKGKGQMRTFWLNTINTS